MVEEGIPAGWGPSGLASVWRTADQWRHLNGEVLNPKRWEEAGRGHSRWQEQWVRAWNKCSLVAHAVKNLPAV